jgi:hypothetical protein
MSIQVNLMAYETTMIRRLADHIRETLNFVL